MPVTPYVVGQWVRGNKFYGRRELVEGILHGNRNCLWLLGTRRIGKTSILKQLEHLTSSSPELGYFSVFWDFQGAEKPEDLNESFGESLLDALDRLGDVGIPLERVQADDLFESISRLRRELRGKNLVLLLLGDEVEELVHVKEKAPRFLPRLRRALQSAENIRTVLASKIKLWDLASEQTSTSPFLHGFTPPLFVHGLTDDEARSLVRQSQLPEDSRPDFDEKTIEVIRTHCNNHPYLLQLLCERYVERMELEQAIEEIATDQMVRHFFAVDFEMLTESERNIIRIIGEEKEATTHVIQGTLGLSSAALSGDLSRLKNLGFIRRAAEGDYTLANFFFKRWFRELPRTERGGPADPGVLEPTIQDADLVIGNGEESFGRIDERYELLGLLGRGATGKVYKAHDTLLNTVIAVKLFKAEYCAEEEAVARLRREVLLSRNLTHPNILKIYDLGGDNDQRYVTMQYVKGPDLAEVISKEGPLAIGKAVAIATKLAAALEAAHQSKVLHRDIKPSNILIDEAGEPRIADFGVARLLDGPEITKSGVFLGTPVYASPEQITGARVDGRTDLYSLGVVTFEMVVGRRPFVADNAEKMCRMHIEASPPPPRDLRPEVSEELSAILLRCLAKDPNQRFQNAAELRDALDALGI